MKIHFSPKTFQNTKPLLPLVPVDETSTLTKSNTCQFELSSNPGMNSAATYKKTVQILKGSKSLWTAINWRIDIDAVLQGLSLTTGGAQVPICKAMLTDMPKSVFQSQLASLLLAAREQAIEAVADTEAHTEIENRDAEFLQ